MLMPCTREVKGLNPSQDTDYTEVFLCLLSVSQQLLTRKLSLDHDSFLSPSIQFITLLHYQAVVRRYYTASITDSIVK